jgi:hypothetical protein
LMVIIAVLQRKTDTVNSLEILVPSARMSQKRDPYAKKGMNFMVHSDRNDTF